MSRQYVYLHDYKCAFLFDNLNRTNFKFVIFLQSNVRQNF